MYRRQLDFLLKNMETISISRAGMILESSISDTEISSFQSNKRQSEALDAPLQRFKGVLMQKHVRREAQICSQNPHLCLGNFVLQSEAAKVCDDAAIKVKRDDPCCNFSVTDLTVQELVFRSLHSVEEMSNMMKDGSYESKFLDFKMVQYTKEGSEARDLLTDRENFCQELFRKELTPSDVSGLNRLVIPKKYAVVHFPRIRNTRARGNANRRQAVGIQITLQDKGLKTWNFGYCYWKSSQSFVITKGWKEFVKEARLKPKDIVIFYGSQEGRMASIIDVECNDSGSSGGLLGSHVGLQPDLKRDFEVQDGEDEREGKEMKIGFKLFGVEIKEGGGYGNGV